MNYQFLSQKYKKRSTDFFSTALSMLDYTTSIITDYYAC